MTRFFNSSIRTKLIVLLSVLCLLFSCIGLYACGEVMDVEDPTYSTNEETDDVLIKNASFNIGTYGTELKNYPIASPNSWTKAQTDNGSTSSSVSSGTVDTAEDSWDVLLRTLYSDSDFASYLKNMHNKNKSEEDDEFSDSKIEDAIRKEKGDDKYEVSKEEITEYAIKEYVKKMYSNPGKSPEAKDDYIYMLNNIGKSAYYQLGLAQKITSSSTVTMEKDKVYAVSVWVKTVNLDGQGEIGANIRLTNSFDSKSQAEYRISNIVANEWTKYTIYVKSDVEYTGTFTLVLGLGYGNGDANATDYYTEGTAYFDDITITETDAKDFTETLTADYMVLGGEDPVNANLVKKADTHYTCLYEMNFSREEDGYLKALTSPTVTSAFTTSNVIGENGAITSENKVGVGESTQTLTDNNDGSYTMAVNKASATITLKDDSFSIVNDEYALISFYLKNELIAPADTNVYVDVMDEYKGSTVKRAAVINVAEPSDNFARYVLIIKNNFTNETTPRTFYLNIIVGPNDVASVVYNSDFSTGTVTVKDFKIAKDSLDSDKATEDFENIYDFLSDKATATVALHAGYENEYTEETEASSYKFSTRPGNFGDILTNPTAVQNYTGIVPNHTYITSNDDAETKVDTRIGKGTTDGVAGLINTKYLDKYTDANEIKEELGFNTGDDDMQLVMINNKTAGHYGFVGNKLSLSTNSNGVVSVTLRVCEGATAYVYLADVSGTEKNVLTFDSFTVNTDVVKGVAKNTEIDGSALRYELKVTNDMMNADGFVTVSFYLGTGATAKSFRVEVWNGARDGESTTASQGYVFVKEIYTSTSNGFNEGASWNSTFATAGNPLYDNHKASFDKLIAYERQLSDVEIKYNKEYPDSTISYSPNYVWAQSKTVVYGVLNTIDPVATDPYADVEEEEESSAGCAAEADPSTFWLSFSSIVLAVILFAAIIVLILKRSLAKRKANKSDALSHYKVTSRIRKAPKSEKLEDTEIQTNEEKEESVNAEEVVEQPTEENAEEANSNEYVYGEVQSFGDESTETTEEKATEVEEKPTEDESK